MGVAALILAILGYCICWIPGVGWLGVALGAVAAVLGVPALTVWYSRSGYTAWGISGTLVGTVTMSLGLAYQVKHAAGALDFLIRPLPGPLAYGVLAGLTALLVAGILLTRLAKRRALGMAVAFLAIAAIAATGASAFTTADRLVERAAHDESPGPL